MVCAVKDISRGGSMELCKGEWHWYGDLTPRTRDRSSPATWSQPQLGDVPEPHKWCPSTGPFTAIDSLFMNYSNFFCFLFLSILAMREDAMTKSCYRRPNLPQHESQVCGCARCSGGTYSSPGVPFSKWQILSSCRSCACFRGSEDHQEALSSCEASWAVSFCKPIENLIRRIYKSTVWWFMKKTKS